MKPASEIFNEVGRDIDSVVEALDLTGESLAQHRAFTVSDIAKIIEDAKAGEISKSFNLPQLMAVVEAARDLQKLNNWCVGLRPDSDSRGLGNNLADALSALDAANKHLDE